MENLALFIRMVRESQGISQKEIAETIKISQSAIAQYEKLQATLSPETLLKIAPLLNLNPEYIRTGIGNPFKQVDKQKIIKMFLPENPLEEIDYSLIDLIAKYNKEATFILLLPILYEREIGLFKKIRSRLKPYGYWYALLIEDSDNNKFIFRRKDKEKIVVCTPDWFTKLNSLNKEGEKYFEIKAIELTGNLFKNIEEWSNINVKELNTLLKSVNRREHIDFLRRLINKIWSHKSIKNQKEAKKIREIITSMDYEDLDRLIAILVPEFAEIIKKHLQPKTELNNDKG